MRSDPDRLNDILDAIAKIKAKLPRDVEAFQSDEMLQVWVIHHLQIIGEAAGGLSRSFRSAHSGVPWAQIVALRNILVHEYFGLNLHQVWVMAQSELSVLEGQVRQIQSEAGTGP